jgi:predicted Rossmann fold flavoprotein
MGLGHSITKLAASLNAFFTYETWTAEVSGLSFEKAELRAPRRDSSTSLGMTYKFTGPFLFTHKGVSGPAVFALSSQVAFENYDKNEPLKIEIDLFPDETSKELFARVERAIVDGGKKSTLNILAIIIPKSLVEIMLRELSIDGSLHAVEIGRKNFLRIVEWMKSIPLHVVGRGAGDEFVTAGGVKLEEVDPQTMESKICPGLYFAGEILDVDGYTGGFNLQASWATGRLAGTSIGSQ